MELYISNATYKKLWEIMQTEGLDNSILHLESTLGLLIENYEKRREMKKFLPQVYAENEKVLKKIPGKINGGGYQFALFRLWELSHNKKITDEKGKVNPDNYAAATEDILLGAIGGGRDYHYVHSADLMMPNINGANNLGIMGRLMDAEAYRRGEPLYWHTAAIRPQLNDAQIEGMNKGYKKFLQAVEKDGFNPEISQVTAWGTENGIGISGGTHRLGFLLSKNENFFVPLKISPVAIDEEVQPPQKNPNADPYYSFKAAGIPTEKIDEMKARYALLVSKLRRTVDVFIDLPLFAANKAAVFAAVEKVGKVTDLNLGRSQMPREKREAGFDEVLQKIYPMENFVILKVDLNYQALYYKKGKVCSFVGDGITGDLTAALGKNWGYAAGTVTESVKLEEKLFDFAANERQFARPYILEKVQNDVAR